VIRYTSSLYSETFHLIDMAVQKVWWESQKERDHYEDQDVDGWIILKWILDRIG
jgi:hypothetical protein